MNTGYQGNQDCLGNINQARTVEGFCVLNIYEEAGREWFNQATKERGTVAKGTDGELHFQAA